MKNKQLKVVFGFLAVLVVTFLQANAQNKDIELPKSDWVKPVPDSGIIQTGRLSWQIKLGLNFGTLYGTDATDSISAGNKPKFKPGILLGLALNNRIGKIWSLQHEILYQQLGAIVGLSTTNTSGIKTLTDGRLSLNYLAISPCNIGLGFGRVKLTVGPYMAMLLSAGMQHFNSNGELVTDNAIYGNSSTLKNYAFKLDFGAKIGTEFNVYKGFCLGANIQQGIMPVIGENTLSQAADWDIKNFGIGVLASYKLANR